LQRYPDVMGHFDQLYLSHEVGFRKPGAEAFKQVCELMQTDPQQVTFLDDSKENVDGARAGGLTAFLTQGETQVLKVLNAL
jgi:putative hydrolase of the HAD superfamily